MYSCELDRTEFYVPASRVVYCNMIGVKLVHARPRLLSPSFGCTISLDLAGKAHTTRARTHTLAACGTRMVCCEALLFFGPCFFVAGVILYPQMLAAGRPPAKLTNC